MVLFAHGSGSSCLSPRNRSVARVLQQAGIGALLFDLLTAEEEALDNKTAQQRFDVDLLSSRLVKTTNWLAPMPKIEDVKLGYFVEEVARLAREWFELHLGRRVDQSQAA